MDRAVERPHHPVNRSRTEPWALLIPGLALLGVGFALPVVWMLGLSFLGTGASGATLENFAKVFTSTFYQDAIWRSLRLSLIQTFLTVALALPVAYLMARSGSRLRTLLLIVIILPLMTSVVIRTFGWTVLMGPTGLFSRIPGVQSLGRGYQGMLGTELGIVIAMVQVLIPYAVLTTLGVLSKIDGTLEEAARTLGAGFWKTLHTVTLPLAIPGMLAGGTLVFALSVSSFVTPRLIGGQQLPVLAGTIYADATTNLNWPLAAAQAVILFAGVIVMISLASKLGKRSR